MKVHVPYSYSPDRPKAKPHVGVTMVELREISASAAPVAAEFSFLRAGEPSTSQFRSFEGKLYQRVQDTESKGVRECSAARLLGPFSKEVSPETIIWNIKKPKQLSLHDVLRHPLRPRRRHAWHWGAFETPIPVSPERRGSDDAREIAAINTLAKEHLIIGGEVWRESPGPVAMCYYNWSSGPVIYWQHPERVLAQSDAMPLMFRADRFELARELASAMSGQDPRIEGNAPVIIDSTAFNYDMLPGATEEMAFLAMWSARRVTIKESGRDFVEAVEAVRAALRHRYPLHDLNFNPSKWPELMPFEPGQTTFAPADPFVPQLRRLQALLSDQKDWKNEYGSILDWRMKNESPDLLDDHEAIASMNL